MSNTRISGLLICAGLSSRMGKFKPLMEYNGETFVNGITKKLLEVCDKVVVVTGYQKEKVEASINSQFSSLNSQLVTCVFNPVYEMGMFTSLKTGVEHLKECEWILYHFVDQPFHKPEFYKAFIEQIDNEYGWIQPLFKSKFGHPILFNNQVAQMIGFSFPNSNLKVVSESSIIRKKYWECNFPEVLIDYDTEADISSYSER